MDIILPVKAPKAQNWKTKKEQYSEQYLSKLGQRE